MFSVYPIEHTYKPQINQERPPNYFNHKSSNNTNLEGLRKINNDTNIIREILLSFLLKDIFRTMIKNDSFDDNVTNIINLFKSIIEPNELSELNENKLKEYLETINEDRVNKFGLWLDVSISTLRMYKTYTYGKNKSNRSNKYNSNKHIYLRCPPNYSCSTNLFYYHHDNNKLICYTNKLICDTNQKSIVEAGYMSRLPTSIIYKKVFGEIMEEKAEALHKFIISYLKPDYYYITPLDSMRRILNKLSNSEILERINSSELDVNLQPIQSEKILRYSNMGKHFIFPDPSEKYRVINKNPFNL